MPRHDALHLYRPAIDPLPPDFLACYTSHKRSSLSDIQELTGKGRPHTTDADIVVFVRNPTLPPTRSDKPSSVGRAACLLNDEPVGIYAPLLMRPWIVQACHSTASCHLDTTRTLRMLERFYWWIGMNVYTRWWLRHCLIAKRGKPHGCLSAGQSFQCFYRKVQVSPSVLTISAPFRSRQEATPTFCCSPIASVVGPTCSPSLPLSSRRRVQPISW